MPALTLSPWRHWRALLPTLLLGLASPLHAADPPRAPAVDEDAYSGRTHWSTARLDPPGVRYQRTQTPRGTQRIVADFLSLGGRPLRVDFALAPDAGSASAREFGVSEAELDALMARCEAGGGCTQAVFDRYTTRYYEDHALRLAHTPGRTPRLQVDIAKVVARNRERVRPVALALRRLAAEHGQDETWAVEAAIALVQGGLDYRTPPTQDRGRKTLGFYPPPLALERGYGDCDTKAALLAAILQNLSDAPLIGVHVPQHYLLGIALPPRPGQAQLRFGGQVYVLVEAAGPARRAPGAVSETTAAALAQGHGLRIDPIS